MLTASPRERRIRVCVRVRPFTKNEAVKAGGKAAWTWHGNAIYQQIFPAHASGNAHLPSSYAFDHVYGPTAHTAQLYADAVRDATAAAVDGYHAAVFVYGQTGTGKTHTMQGTRAEPGLISLAVEDLFALVARHADSEFLLRMTYLEIYNERVFDLLADGARTDAKIYETASSDVVVHGLQEHAIASAQHVLALVAQGNAFRHVATTEANDNSSRAHTILRLVVERQHKQQHSNNSSTVATLNLVDLAGSESVRLANTTGVQLEEGRHINRSLLTLGHIIWKLSRHSSVTTDHLPYRNSKLTRLLQPALGGKAQIAIVATVAPSTECLAETHNTLKFAARARRVRSHLRRATGESALLRKYRARLGELQAERAALKPDADATRQRELQFAIDNIHRVILNSSAAKHDDNLIGKNNNSSPATDADDDDDDEDDTTDDEAAAATKRDSLAEPESESVTGRLTELSDAAPSMALPAALKTRYLAELAGLGEGDASRPLLAEFVRALELADAAYAALQRENQQLRDALGGHLK